MRKTGAEIKSSWEKEKEAEKKKYGGFEKYEVEEWVRCVEKCGEIMSDPKKMAAVSKCLSMKEDGLEKVKKFMKQDDQGK